ncbi:MAG: TolC family protein [Bacteroidetes bacterium]|nr:TolC family protein [Bacteroidota bacterium]
MNRCFLLFFFLAAACTSRAQSNADTLQMDMQQAEKIFLQKNLSLLAAQYNVNINEALIKQAKLWDNPVLATDQNIYDNSGKFFAHNADNGQVYVQVQQLIRTAGKRTKLAQLAVDNTQLAKEQFDDVMRSLRYTLQSDFLELSHLMKTKKVYDGEIAEMEHLVYGVNEEYKAGNISLKDNMRLKALLFSLKNELVNVQAQLMPLQTEVHFLLQDSSTTFIEPQFDYQLPAIINYKLDPLDSLVARAIASRPDAKMAQTQLDFQNHNLVYQKALAKPDVTVGTEFDQRSSYAPNYVGLAVSLPLNIFNKNQGNIKSAQFAVKQQAVIKDQQTLKIQSEVSSAVQKFLYYQKVNDPEQLTFSQQYDTLFNNMIKSYRDRQLNLLDLIDFIDAYKDSKLKLTDQHNSLVKSALDLNYTINSTIIDVK